MTNIFKKLTSFSEIFLNCCVDLDFNHNFVQRSWGVTLYNFTGKSVWKTFVLLHCTQFLSLLSGPYLTAYSHTWKDVLSTSQTEYCLKQRPLFKKSKLRRTRLKAGGDWLQFGKARDYGSSRSRFPSRAWRYSKAHSSGLMEQEISRCKSVVNKVGKKC